VRNKDSSDIFSVQFAYEVLFSNSR